MKRILKTIGMALLVMLVVALVRASLKKYVPKLYTSVWGTTIQTTTGTKQDQTEPSKSQVQSQEVSPGEPAQTKEHKDELYATGKLWGRGQVLVVMSDGTVRSMEDNTEPGHPRVQRIQRRFMDMGGKRYYLTPRPPDKEKIPKEDKPKEAEPTNRESAQQDPEPPKETPHTEEDAPKPLRVEPVPIRRAQRAKLPVKDVNNLSKTKGMKVN